MKTMLGVSFAVAILLEIHPASAYVYDVHPCTPGIDCPDMTHSDSSPAPPPTNADFQNFYGAQLGFDLSGDSFTWTGKAVNGYWFGLVDDTSFGIHSSYLWNGSTVLCCTMDEPYQIVDANYVGLFVGNDIYGYSNAGQPVYPGFLAGPGGPYALPPVEFALTAEGTDYLASLGNPPIRFVAMGDAYDMLGQWDGGYLLFSANDDGGPLARAPEPVSALLLLPGLALLRRFKRRQ